MLLGVINFKMREKILFLNGFSYLYELQLQTEKRKTKSSSIHWFTPHCPQQPTKRLKLHTGLLHECQGPKLGYLLIHSHTQQQGSGQEAKQQLLKVTIIGDASFPGRGLIHCATVSANNPIFQMPSLEAHREHNVMILTGNWRCVSEIQIGIKDAGVDL